MKNHEEPDFINHKAEPVEDILELNQKTSNHSETNPENKERKERKRKFLIFIFTFVGLLLLFIGYNYQQKISTNTNDLKFDSAFTVQTDPLKNKEKIDTSVVEIIEQSILDSTYLPSTDSNEVLGLDAGSNVSTQNKYTGRRINIAVTGVDSRLGSRFKHADANHIISILLDIGKIEIISVPRDTPAEAGFPEESGQNKLTVTRQALGRTGYLKTLANIAGIDKIHYYVEFGFSQAMGIIDWLGYKDKSSTLQVLRSRTGLGGDDFQRCYNQGQFIRQNILKNFNKLNGIMGTILVPPLLMIVDTDLSSSNIFSILEELKKADFGKPEDITVQVKPRLGVKFKVYDFTNQETVDNLKQKIEHFNIYNKHIDSTTKTNVQTTVSNSLYNLIQNNTKDTLKNPTKVINNLSAIFEQKSWLQINDSTKRNDYRNKIAELLIVSYTKKNKLDKVKQIKEYIELEDKLYENKLRLAPKN